MEDEQKETLPVVSKQFKTKYIMHHNTPQKDGTTKQLKILV